MAAVEETEGLAYIGLRLPRVEGRQSAEIGKKGTFDMDAWIADNLVP
ncbi:hypothetical protein [Burkholderia plantarii]|nr:hypothetical protein [Burkholderia plantarii]